VCAEIRGRLDWYRIDGMATKDARQLAAQQLETAVQNLRQNGALQALAAPAARLALEAA
jgi:hypothetical protein